MAYGFRPVQMAGSRYQTGGSVKVPIDDGSVGTAIYNGGTVVYTIDAATGNSGINVNDDPEDTGGTTSVGVLVGATWENSSNDPNWRHYYAGTGAAGKSFGCIVPLVGVIFQIQGNLAWDRKFIGWECLTTGSGGSTATGNSNLSLLQVTSDASNGCILPMGVLENGNENTSTPDVLVRFAAAGITTKPLF